MSNFLGRSSVSLCRRTPSASVIRISTGAVAVRALAAHTARMLVRDGADGARKKIVVETFDGAPVLSTPFADVLQKAGFVRLPDGMRLYVDPFAR